MFPAGIQWGRERGRGWGRGGRGWGRGGWGWGWRARELCIIFDA